MDLHVALSSNDPLYWVGWLVALTIITFPLLLGKYASIKTRKRFEKTWAVALVISYFAMTGLSYMRGEASWGTSLLVHMCGFSRLLLIGYFFTRKRWMGELVTFTGIAGGMQSLLTPEFTHGMHPVYVFDYYFNHASIVAIGFYILIVHRQKLTRYSWLRAFGRTQLLALIALGVNLITGGNYMYLMEPPIVDNPLIVTSDSFPYLHVVFFQVFAAINFFLVQVVLTRIPVRPTYGYSTS